MASSPPIAVSASESQQKIYSALRGFDDNNSHVGRLLLSALVARYEAKAMDAIARLKVYHSNPTGIGEHPQLTDEMAKLVEQVGSALDCIATLTRIDS